MRLDASVKVTEILACQRVAVILGMTRNKHLSARLAAYHSRTRLFADRQHIERTQAADVAELHFDDFAGVATLAEGALDGELTGVHAFCDSDIFAAVYSSNLLMRCSDVLVTKPSEFSFYPVPKLMIHRVGGHEAWGAIRAAEVGDGTYEIDDTDEVLAMIDAFQLDRELLCTMCDRIEDANKIGIYDGAYKVIDLAVRGQA